MVAGMFKLPPLALGDAKQRDGKLSMARNTKHGHHRLAIDSFLALCSFDRCQRPTLEFAALGAALDL